MSQYPILGDDSIMSKKKHGTSDAPVQKVSSSIVYLYGLILFIRSCAGNATMKPQIPSVTSTVIMQNIQATFWKQVFLKKIMRGKKLLSTILVCDFSVI